MTTAPGQAINQPDNTADTTQRLLDLQVRIEHLRALVRAQGAGHEAASELLRILEPEAETLQRSSHSPKASAARDAGS